MYLIVGLGSNIGKKTTNLDIAIRELENIFGKCKKSNLYISDPVDYQNQPTLQHDSNHKNIQMVNQLLQTHKI